MVQFYMLHDANGVPKARIPAPEAVKVVASDDGVWATQRYSRDPKREVRIIRVSQECGFRFGIQGGPEYTIFMQKGDELIPE
jgi:hypothetical protein